MLYAVAEFSEEVVGTGQQCSGVNWFRVSGLYPDGRGNWSWSLLCVGPGLCFGLSEVFLMCFLGGKFFSCSFFVII